MATIGIGIQRVDDLRRQTIEPMAHIDRLALALQPSCNPLAERRAVNVAGAVFARHLPRADLVSHFQKLVIQI